MIRLLLWEVILDKRGSLKIGVRDFLDHRVYIFCRERSLEVACAKYFEIEVYFFCVLHEIELSVAAGGHFDGVGADRIQGAAEEMVKLADKQDI